MLRQSQGRAANSAVAVVRPGWWFGQHKSIGYSPCGIARGGLGGPGTDSRVSTRRKLGSEASDASAGVVVALDSGPMPRPGPMPALPEGPAAKRYPPLLTGGYEQTREAWSRGVDWLTLTMPTAMAQELVAGSSLVEVGQPKLGFERTERRMMSGGFAWRKFEPRSLSKSWGREYETWEWSGGGSDVIAKALAPRGRPSRIDVAWDFECPGDLSAAKFFRSMMRRHVVAETRLCVEPKGPMPRRGEFDSRTWMIGAASSDWRLRVYRKDIQQPELQQIVGPLMRVELIASDVNAQRLWIAFGEDPQRGYAAAARQVERMTGLAPQIGMVELPHLDKPPVLEVAQRFFEFMQQHASTLRAAEEAGVPLARMAAMLRVGRTTAWSQEQKAKAIRQCGTRAFVALLAQLIESHAALEPEAV